MQILPTMMTVSEVMDALRCSRNYVYGLCRSNRLTYKKISPRKTLIYADSVKPLLKPDF